MVTKLKDSLQMLHRCNERAEYETDYVFVTEEAEQDVHNLMKIQSNEIVTLACNTITDDEVDSLTNILKIDIY